MNLKGLFYDSMVIISDLKSLFQGCVHVFYIFFVASICKEVEVWKKPTKVWSTDSCIWRTRMNLADLGTIIKAAHLWSLCLQFGVEVFSRGSVYLHFQSRFCWFTGLLTYNEYWVLVIWRMHRHDGWVFDVLLVLEGVLMFC